MEQNQECIKNTTTLIIVKKIEVKKYGKTSKLIF